MRVVSNSSPLIFLSKLGELDLLAACFTEISIPQAVREEVGDLELPGFVRVRSISEFGKHYVTGALGMLHGGELEAMVLTQEEGADRVVLDDLCARHKAKRMGLNVIGTIGVLRLAYAKGLIGHSKLLAHYDALVRQHGMWISANVLERLRDV